MPANICVDAIVSVCVCVCDRARSVHFKCACARHTTLELTYTNVIHKQACFSKLYHENTNLAFPKSEMFCLNENLPRF
jgi:hypothetical protein